MAGCCSDEHNPEAVSKDVCCDPSGAIKCSATATTSVNTMTGSRLSSFRIEQMDCPTEQTLIQDKLSKLAGVDKLDFNLINRILGVWHNLPSTAPIEAAISSLGMQAEPLSAEGQARIKIEQMDCPTEEKLIRDKLSSLPSISALEFNLLQRVLTLRHTADALPAALAAIRELGFTPVVEGSATANDEAQEAPRKKAWWPLALSGVAAISAEVTHFAELAPEWVVAGVALLAILLCGLTTYKKGWIALKNRNLNINALMSIAVTGAVLIGQWPEAAMVMFLFAVAELIEAKSLDRARDAIRGLMDLTPERATVQQTDGTWLEVEVKTITLGTLVRVRPGERIGLDGEVTSGNSTINQAPITGESLPVEKTIGDPVFAGTINEAGSLEYRVVAAAANTTLARIIHAVEEAQGSRAPTQRFVDQFAKVYTPVVFLFALAIAIVPPLFMAEPWYDWIYRALVLLVVACPCALVISTPVTIVSGLAAAARKGILIKGGVYLETGGKLGFLALDKTGTITHGKPVQTDYMPLVEQDSELYRTHAASLASRSDHPVSQAIAKHAIENGLTFAVVEGLEALPGRGVRGTIDGTDFHLGNHRLVEELGLCSPELEATLERLERQGKTVVVLCNPQRAIAMFAVADTVKESSRQAIDELHALGVKTTMLTGDNPHTAEAIAKQVGIDEARGNLLPVDKLQAIEALQTRGYVVGMVGDGINDAPALAKSEIGFAMAAAGTDTAIETADVALMDDDLRKIPAFIRLSQQTAAILKQNIALALGIKALFIVITLTGQATMWMAVFADMGVSLLVVFNGLRLLKK